MKSVIIDLGDGLSIRCQCAIVNSAFAIVHEADLCVADGEGGQFCTRLTPIVEKLGIQEKLDELAFAAAIADDKPEYWEKSAGQREWIPGRDN